MWGNSSTRIAVAVAATLLLVLTVANGSPAARRHSAEHPKTTHQQAERVATAQRVRERLGGSWGSGLTCEACKILVDTLDTMFMENKTSDDIVDVITELCVDLQIEDRNVCTLGVREFKVCVLYTIT